MILFMAKNNAYFVFLDKKKENNMIKMMCMKDLFMDTEDVTWFSPPQS